ncbi:hypothetical protein T310_1548 [Rasamsonia emersonii CBS 393.64]|uniref:Uncharacterized protein n=1 Tax=Rasamsonia emersonii (strain ATCC 16479 / CBS 393.64 / IMI 116815) TaxID=1408163 RepID=A0A0F4Z1N2_RASE3|nr:hypothetical protein T310_1548 [Rasamsonia emersonii CBS 393.64]KKA24427.1 hypothetical protein T310_1548 [Rasamsonia emersonii CBS 393.64]
MTIDPSRKDAEWLLRCLKDPNGLGSVQAFEPPHDDCGHTRTSCRASPCRALIPAPRLGFAAGQKNGKEPCLVTILRQHKVKYLICWIKTYDKSKPEPVNETSDHVPFLSTDCLEDLPPVCIGRELVPDLGSVALTVSHVDTPCHAVGGATLQAPATIALALGPKPYAGTDLAPCLLPTYLPIYLSLCSCYSNPCATYLFENDPANRLGIKLWYKLKENNEDAELKIMMVSVTQ